MKRFMNKKVAAIGLAAGLALGAAGAAFAYFQTSGSGQGSTTAGTASTVTLQATIAGAIVPGDGGQSVTFTATNLNSTSAKVTTISFVSVTSSTPACQAVITANPSQFSMTDVSSGTVVPANSTVPVSLAGTGTLVWADSLTQDQTACAGQPLTLHVSSV
jgi:hypothetical protein